MMYNFEVSRIFGPPEAQLQTDGILVEVSSFVPQETDIDHCLSHHLLLSWLSPQPTRMRGCFGYPFPAHRLSDFRNLAFIPAAVPTLCRYQSGEQPQRAIAVRLAPHLLDHLDGDASRYDPYSLASCNFRDPDIVDGMRQLAREAMAPGFASKVLVESIGTALLIRLARRQGLRSRDEVTRGGLAPWQMRRITERIADDSGADPLPTLVELAALAGISPAHLRRAFKQSTGSTIGEHIRQVQFERARTLLADTDLRLNEIATRLGFSAPYGFTVAFQRSAGETPSAFRQRMRAGRGN